MKAEWHLEIAVGLTFEVVGESFLALRTGFITGREREMPYDERERVGESIKALFCTLRHP